MRAVGIAAGLRNLLRGKEGGRKERLCMINPHPDQIVLKGYSEKTRIKMLKMRDTHTEFRRMAADGMLFGQ